METKPIYDGPLHQTTAVREDPMHMYCMTESVALDWPSLALGQVEMLLFLPTPNQQEAVVGIMALSTSLFPISRRLWL